MADDSNTIATISTLGGVILTQIANSVWQWRKSRSEDLSLQSKERAEQSRVRADERRIDVEAGEAAVKSLLSVVARLTDDIKRLSTELEEERSARRRADEAVRQLRVELDAMRSALQRCGTGCEVAEHFAAIQRPAADGSRFIEG